LVLNVKDGTGYLIQHSYPEAPFQIYGTAIFSISVILIETFLPEPTGEWSSHFWNPAPNGRNVFSRAQHAFCFSFSGNEVKDIIQQLIHARPAWVSSNLSLWLIEEMLKNDQATLTLLKNLILGLSIIPKANVLFDIDE